MIITNKTNQVITLYNSKFSVDIACDQNVDVSNEWLESENVFIKYCFEEDVKNEVDTGWSSSTIYQIKLPMLESFSIMKSDFHVKSLLFPTINLKLFKCVSENGVEVSGENLFTSSKAKRKILIIQFLKILILSCLLPFVLMYSFISSYGFINKAATEIAEIEYMIGGWIIFLLLLVFYVPNLKLLIYALRFKRYDKSC